MNKKYNHADYRCGSENGENKKNNNYNRTSHRE